MERSGVTVSCQTDTHLLSGYSSTFLKVSGPHSPPNPCDSCAWLSQCEQILSPHIKMNGKHLLEDDPTLQGSCSSLIIQSQRWDKGVGADDLPLDSTVFCLAPCTSIAPLKWANEMIIKRRWGWMTWKSVKAIKYKTGVRGGRVVASHHPFTPIGNDATNQWCLTEKIGSKQLMQQFRKSLLIQFSVRMCNVLREADVVWCPSVGLCCTQHAEQGPASTENYRPPHSTIHSYSI